MICWRRLLKTNCTERDLKLDLNQYLSSLVKSKVRTIDEVAKFNEDHKDLELPPGKTVYTSSLCKPNDPRQGQSRPNPSGRELYHDRLGV